MHADRTHRKEAFPGDARAASHHHQLFARVSPIKGPILLLALAALCHAFATEHTLARAQALVKPSVVSLTSTKTSTASDGAEAESRKNYTE